MILPNAERAIIDMAKLADYCLSPTHEVGKHKAAVFQAVLGLSQIDEPFLAIQIRQGVRQHPAIPGVADEFGQRYQVDIPLTTAAGSAIVRTAWIIRTREEDPRLVTSSIPKG